VDSFVLDLRYAARQLAKSPVFTVVVVLTLALGIGANTAIFSLMDQILFRPLPVKSPERLVLIDTPGPNSGHISSHLDWPQPVSHPLFIELRDKASVFSGVLVYTPAEVHVGVAGQTERAQGALVSGTYFEVLGVPPALGRVFGPADDVTPGGEPKVILSHGYWQRRFASDNAIVGRVVSVNGEPMTVIGVAQKGFRGTEVDKAIDVFVPLMMQARVIPTMDALGKPRVCWLTAMARLKDGLSVEEATAGAQLLYSQFLAEDLKTIQTPSASFKEGFLAKKIVLAPGGHGASGLGKQSKAPLLVLMGMVGLVLLIACANVANLLLARATSRQREVAVRLALGAGRGRIVRQLLAESGVLALLGGVAGLAVAGWTSTLLIRALPGEDTARALQTDLDPRVGLFALGVSILASLLFGLVPAIQVTRPDLFATLRTEVGSVMGSAGPLRFRRALVVVQVALSLLLLIGAGLFARSLANLRNLDPGFRPDSLLTFDLDPSLHGYDDRRASQLLDRIRDDLRAEPGVSSVSMANVALMTGSDNSSTVHVEGYQAKDGENMNPNFNAVAPGFFKTLGIPLLRGRDFTDADVAGAPKVAIVNEAFARYFFKDQDPVGRRFGMGRNEAFDFTIVGLARDGKAANLREDSLRFVYRPYPQEPNFGDLTYYVRTSGDVAALSDRIQALVRAADPELPVTALKTMQAQIRESLFAERLTAALSAAFGLLATSLAALGLYGVMSYAVSRRTREIGIRMALGAERRAVLLLVMTEVAVLAGIGVAIGLPSSFALGQLMRSQLFGLSPTDPLTASAATALLVGVSLASGLLPALRASRVDPILALRVE
jgi:predicted permease